MVLLHRTWKLVGSTCTKVGARSMPRDPLRAGGHAADIALLYEIVGTADVKPSSGRFHTLCDLAEQWFGGIVKARKAMISARMS